MQLVVNTKILIYCALLGIIILVSGVMLGWRIFPKIVENKVWENSILRENTSQWEMFKKIPFPFQMKITFFNVQNPEDILQGAKPVVEEIGPYVYKLYRWKSDVEWTADDEISYYDYTRFEFDAAASGKLSDHDKVTILNSPYNALLLTVEEMSPDALETIDQVLPDVFGKYNGLFITAKVKDLLFDGITICENGAEHSFAGKMVCKQFQDKAESAKLSKPMKIVGKSISYANIRYKNYTHLGRFTIKSGAKVPEEISNLVQYENSNYSSNWMGGNGSKCNKIRGTTTFRPYVTKDMAFETFGEDICRVMSMVYKSSEIVKGIEGLKFGALNTTLNAPLKNSPDSCFCLNRSQDIDGTFGCLRNGVLDMTTCMGAPVILSFPHFLYGDDVYIKSVQGLHPDEKIHESFVILEPTSGAPLKMAKRVQFNMFIRAIPDIIEIENVSNAIMPMFWIEESMTLDDKTINFIKENLLNNLKLLEVIKWGIVGFGALAVIIPMALIIYKN